MNTLEPEQRGGRREGERERGEYPKKINRGPDIDVPNLMNKFGEINAEDDAQGSAGPTKT